MRLMFDLISKIGLSRYIGTYSSLRVVAPVTARQGDQITFYNLFPLASTSLAPYQILYQSKMHIQPPRSSLVHILNFIAPNIRIQSFHTNLIT